MISERAYSLILREMSKQMLEEIEILGQETLEVRLVNDVKPAKLPGTGGTGKSTERNITRT